MYFTFQGLQYLLNSLHFLDILDFELSLLLGRDHDGRDNHRPAVPLLAFLLIVLRNFLKLQLCITFHHLMQALNKKRERVRCLKILVSVDIDVTFILIT